MKSVLKKLMNGKNKFLNIIILLAIVAVVGMLVKYNTSKSILSDAMSNNPFANVGKVESAPAQKAASDNAAAAAPLAVSPVSTTDGQQFLSVKGMNSVAKKPSNTCNNQPMMDPKELLPTDNNNEWSNIMPSQDLKNVGMLNAGHHIGINTVGSSLRNANLQVRSEPVIPQTKNVGPWNNTTIEPDNLRRPLEIGGSE